MQHKDIVRKLFDATALLKNEPIEEALAAVLTTDLLWGNKVLKGDSKPVQTILKYQNIFLQTINDEDFKESLTDQLKTSTFEIQPYSYFNFFKCGFSLMHVIIVI